MRQSKELTVAIKAAKAAGKVIMSHYGNLHYVRLKSRAEGIVTEADIQAQAKIKKIILGEFPNACFLAEEDRHHERPSKLMWLVDPLDGTENFYRGLRLFSVSISLVRNGLPALGVIFEPSSKELFYAEKGKGAFLNGKRIRVSGVKKGGEAMLDVPVSNRLGLRKKQFRRLGKLLKLGSYMRITGSAAVRLAYIAAGRMDGYVEAGMHPWDWAAGALIVQEAGGKVTNLEGKAFRIFKDRDIIASNGKLHKKIMGALRA
jgi:myo-inositol-1(or 4)-monophosphatase